MLYRTFIGTAIALAVMLLVPVYAHPGEEEPTLTPRQLERRQAAINSRHVAVRKCDGAIAAFEAQRRAKRSALAAKGHRNAHHNSYHNPHGSASHPTGTSSATGTANKPSYTALQNTTCVLTPETTEGPYFIHEELFRTDIREGLDGIPLLLDVGVMDVTTCKPMENALVDVWHCNATGIYSGFIASEPSNTGTGSNSSMSGTPSGSMAAMPSGTMTAGGSGGSVATDQETFLRGAYPTNSRGLVEFSTIFPGFYGGRSIHIHTAVLTNYTINKNGTIGLETGEVRHIGQVFFEESWSKLVVATSPYNTETVDRTLNDVDSVYLQENTAGYNATAQLAMVGHNISDGLIGYVTLGVDPTASTSFQSIAYHTGEDDS